MAKFVRKQDSLICLKLREDLYTVAQILVGPLVRFFDIKNQDAVWKNIDFNNVPILFEAFVAGSAIQKLGVEKIKDKTTFASQLPFEWHFIKPYSNFDGGFSFLGGRLVDIRCGDAVDTYQVSVLKENLNLSENRDVIEKYELTNMWVDTDLSDRLCRYFDTGINRDDLKFEIFPGLWDDREALRPLTRRLPVPLR